METIIFIAYIIGWMTTYIMARKEFIKEHEWTIYRYAVAVFYAFFNPIIIPLYLFYKLCTAKFWNKDLPKWF